MVRASRDFQIFVKPVGPLCNLDCRYCYYLKKEQLYPSEERFRMSDTVLETYIIQQINASPSGIVRFSWHGGEPTLLGLDYFRNIVALQRKHRRRNQLITNGIQTNGTLIDEDWSSFFADEGFAVGISIDGPQLIHDRFRVTKDQKASYEQTMRGYRLLQKHLVPTDILCVVNAHNVRFPLQVYRFFKQIDAKYVNFLPMVELEEGSERTSNISVSAGAWGNFLCTIFDEWRDQDIGRIKVHIFEEVIRTAFNQEHLQCLFRPTCGNIPVVEHNGDFYSCDHFVNAEHLLGNILRTPLVKLLESPIQERFGKAKLKTLPRYCIECEVRSMCNGECPKNRFMTTPNGEGGLNYLCEGYKHFFTHCQPFVSAVASLSRHGLMK
jgi:uncharacterized protein